MDGVNNKSTGKAVDSTRGGKFLTFCLGREHYGLSLSRVREIIALMPVAPLPMAPSCVRGVMNLRGRIIPVIDLRCRFDMSPLQDHDRKCIIVVDVEFETTTRQMSLLVDKVSEVIQISNDQIQDAPPCLGGTDTRVIDGIARSDKGVTILLNVDILLLSLDLKLDSSRLAS